MTNKNAQTFDLRFPVAFGSGLATALLFLAARQQSAFAALLLASLAPLPIMIATLGFGEVTGLGAAIASACTITALIAAATTAEFSAKILLSAGIDGLIFAVGLSLPAWWLAWLAGTGRAHFIAPALAAWLGRLGRGGRQGPRPSDREPLAGEPHAPFGDLLLSIAAIAFLIVTVITLIWVARHGSYEAALTKTIAKVEPMIVEMFAARDLPKNLDLATLSRLVIETMPALGASMIAVILAANLWLSGRVVELSHRLPQPWPDIPHQLRVPRFAGLLFVICLGLAFLNGLPGMIARTAAAALGILFVLQGVAVVHDLTRGMRFRSSLLCGLYLAFAFLLPWPLIIFAALGLVEAAFSLRDKKAAPAIPKTSNERK